ncbi:hypothetical protein CUTER_09410 [Corynebacterium uterequi]|uniref:Uncharacterized protein n=1 Tax=Corynebacterium uterequi TaxID=1072256 RepID=A0A0G3HGH2_9CORY|nr:hypothetical protein CUTER_09410 [Corynebacterium uterequi]
MKEAIHEVLRKHGVFFEEMNDERLIFLFAGTAFGDVVLLCFILYFVMSFLAVLLSVRSDAVRRLHGYRLHEAVIHHVASMASWWLAIAIAVVALLTVGAAVRYSLPSAWQWATTQVLLLSASLLVTVGTVVIATALMRQVSVINGIGGKLPALPALLSVYAIKCAAAISLATLMIGLWGYSQEYSRQASEEALWSEIDDVYLIDFNGAPRVEDLQQAGAELAPLLREASARGDVLLARYVDAGLNRNASLGRDMMIFNEQAARTSLHGDIATAFDSYGVLRRPLLLVPESLKGHPHLSDNVTTFIDADAWSTAVYAEKDSTAFTWEGGDSEWMNRSSVANPVVIVFPDDNIALSERNLFALATQGDVMIRGWEQYEALRRGPTLENLLHDAQPIAEVWASNHRSMKTSLWVYGGGTVLSLLLVLAGSIAVWLAASKVFHQRFRASFVLGLRPYRVLGILAAAEAVVLTWCCWFLWQRGATAREWLAGGAHEGSGDPAMIAMMSVPPAAWWTTLGVLVLFSAPMMYLVLQRFNRTQLIKAGK